MKKIVFVICVVLGVCLVSCDNPVIDDSSAYHDYTAYVYSYHFPNDMYLSDDYFYNHVYEWDSYLYSEYGFSVMFTDDYTQTLSQHSQGEEKTRFDALCAKHNDTSFNQRIRYTMPSPPHKYLGFDLVSINVTSDADFDAEHPAGASLNDIVQFIAYTPYPFIQRRYTYSAPEDDSFERWKEEQTLINKPLSECTTEDFILTLGQFDNTLYLCKELPCCYLVVKATPTLSHQHVLKVTIVDDIGQTWHASIDLYWPKE